MTPAAKSAAILLACAATFAGIAYAVGAAGAFLAFVVAGLVWVVWRLLGREIMEGRR